MDDEFDSLDPSPDDTVEILTAKAYASGVGVSLAEGVAAMRFQGEAHEVLDEIELALELRRYAVAAGVRPRFAPHQLRHPHAVELAREGVPLPVIQRQLGHSYVSTTSVYLQRIDVEEIIGTIHARRAPMMHVSAGLEL